MKHDPSSMRENPPQTRVPTHLTPTFDPGTVWLAGAGPGDPGLLTLHALNALNRADVIVHDALVDARVLSLAHANAVLEFAGKRGGKPSATQGDITERLIVLARQGKRVLRLKGGDPFIFGRGCEEAEALVQAGISFRIIPGVSSGLAGLALHGVPATSRDTNHAVILATGHGAEGQELDFKALAQARVPLVLYMAVSRMGGIVTDLLEGGLAPETPALAIHAVSTGQEEVVETTLAELPTRAAEGAIRSPSVVAIGAIAALRKRLEAGLLNAMPAPAADDFMREAALPTPSGQP
ncbi:uroporphyrinogen-III C-methyltransferase [Paracoccus sp. (in: a-proteobacteria)]|uniref:uroporphyrinogen-III C-methyltransferase n=1 Tax=Paracoccus sp. TaxID=267 RepID=UPI002AFF3638|nr:uroporphyrinogen-III C-methyltransferase [Paracoccus sp. (in: a-proteobacteria)]